jgi:uncharacterized RDD family membrane protein YckC
MRGRVTASARLRSALVVAAEKHPAAAPHFEFPVVSEMVPADWGDRLGAGVLDGVVRLALVAAPAGLGAIAFVGGRDAGFAGFGLGILVGFVLALAYAPIMLARDGQTFGHRKVGIRVVRSDGSGIGGGRAFVREVLVKALLMENVALLTAYILTVVNYLWPLWDARNQALHDKICDTLVVRTA